MSVTAVRQAYLDLDIQSFRDAQDIQNSGSVSEAGDSLRIALRLRQANLQADTVSQVDHLEAKLKASKKKQRDLEARNSSLHRYPQARICSLSAGDAERGAALGADSLYLHQGSPNSEISCVQTYAFLAADSKRRSRRQSKASSWCLSRVHRVLQSLKQCWPRD